MSPSICNGLCWRDADTGEIFCPCVPGGWETECPKESCSQARKNAPFSGDKNESEVKE